MDLPTVRLASFHQLRLDTGGFLLARSRGADFSPDRLLLRARTKPDRRFFRGRVTERNSLAGQDAVTYAGARKNNGIY